MFRLARNHAAMSSETLLDIILAELLPEEHKIHMSKIGKGFTRKSRVWREPAESPVSFPGHFGAPGQQGGCGWRWQLSHHAGEERLREGRTLDPRSSGGASKCR